MWSFFKASASVMFIGVSLPSELEKRSQRVVGQRPDDRMFLQELELLLLLAGLPLQQLPDGPQSVGAASPAHVDRPVPAKHSHACPPAPSVPRAPAPLRRPGSWPRPIAACEGRSPQSASGGIGSALDGRDFLTGDVLRCRAEPAWLCLGVDGDLFEPVVEDPDQAGVPADPQSAAHVFRRR